MQEDDEETITNELKEAFRLYDKEGELDEGKAIRKNLKKRQING